MGRGTSAWVTTATPNPPSPTPWSITYSRTDFALRSRIAGAAGETLWGKEAMGAAAAGGPKLGGGHIGSPCHAQLQG